MHIKPATLRQSRPERFHQLSYGSPTVDAEISICLSHQSYELSPKDIYIYILLVLLCPQSFIGGGCASIVGQTVIVPFDVLSQHLMVLGLVKGSSSCGTKNIVMNPLGLDLAQRRSKAALAREVAARVYRLHGALGYYRGYAASLAAYVPNSALWWALYTAYQDELLKISPVWISHLLIQCVAGTLGGFTTTILTNPLDIVRARLQVEGVGSMRQVFKELWREEGLIGLYAKGLSARLVQSACFSFCIILGYESIKRVSVSDEYRARVRW
ncbi:jg3057 [Pararge aegeria aegeria]|uniref:Jg3057 protein n=1 Tax=Pararge aegeria aegeria TaxID=348720 RepID=A0A8S4QVE1_9NEOP|nr:jg3057 [Pararge aegeria aegeria]